MCKDNPCNHSHIAADFCAVIHCYSNLGTHLGRRAIKADIVYVQKSGFYPDEIIVMWGQLCLFMITLEVSITV